MAPTRPARFLLPALVVLLSACASQRGSQPDYRGADAPKTNTEAGKPLISEQSLPLRQPETPTRTVVPGDTLYSIAWETGRDYREIAKWNRIRPPYTILPGQNLRVIPPTADKKPVDPEPDPVRTTAKDKTAKSTKTQASSAQKPTKTPAPTGSKPAAVSANRANTREAQATNKSTPVKSPATVSTGSGSWVWPADGQILKRYSASESSKGIDISGSRGQPVRATASGRVVYMGSGLRGYGQLIIIKHNDEYLSAYAHNDKIHVKEGDAVKRGQKIADMGSTGTDRVKLHFEIRRQGVPTDPLKYLPKR